KGRRHEWDRTILDNRNDWLAQSSDWFLEWKPGVGKCACDGRCCGELDRSGATPARSPGAGPAKRRPQPVRQVQRAEPKPFLPSQDTRTGTVGYYTNSTSVATKTNTPLVNIPQSLTVISKEFIRDQSFQNLTDIARYSPGVAVHQGEGNR